MKSCSGWGLVDGKTLNTQPLCLWMSGLFSVGMFANEIHNPDGEGDECEGRKTSQQAKQAQQGSVGTVTPPNQTQADKKENEQSSPDEADVGLAGVITQGGWHIIRIDRLRDDLEENRSPWQAAWGGENAAGGCFASRGLL